MSKKRLDITIPIMGSRDVMKDIIYAKDIDSVSDDGARIVRIELKDRSARNLMNDKFIIDNFLKSDTEVLECQGSPIDNYRYPYIANK